MIGERNFPKMCAKTAVVWDNSRYFVERRWGGGRDNLFFLTLGSDGRGLHRVISIDWLIRQVQ